MKCYPMMSAEQEAEQHRLYMAAGGDTEAPVDVGGLLYCRVHRRPLIKCYDELQEAIQRVLVNECIGGVFTQTGPDEGTSVRLNSGRKTGR